jgi:hypothetical protein
MTSDYPYGIFTLFFYLISETMILGGVDIYLTNLTTVYLPVYGLPVLLSLSVFALTMSFFKMWIVDREGLVLDLRHYTPRNEVEQPLIRTRLRTRRSNRSRTNRRRSQLVQSTTTSIDFEAELDKPYGEALKEFYSDEQIKRALYPQENFGKEVLKL